jgi:hypothetical protein
VQENDREEVFGLSLEFIQILKTIRPNSNRIGSNGESRQERKGFQLKLKVV